MPQYPRSYVSLPGRKEKTFRILIGTLAALVAVGVLAGCNSEVARDSPEGRNRTSDTGEVGEQAIQSAAGQESTGEVEKTLEGTSQEHLCLEEENVGPREMQIGDFEQPEEEVPRYKILEE